MRSARACYVILETSDGTFVDVELARDDMCQGSLQALGAAVWDSWHDRTYRVTPTIWDAYWPARTLVDWSPT